MLVQVKAVQSTHLEDLHREGCGMAIVLFSMGDCFTGEASDGLNRTGARMASRSNGFGHSNKSF